MLSDKDCKDVIAQLSEDSLVECAIDLHEFRFKFKYNEYFSIGYMNPIFFEIGSKKELLNCLIDLRIEFMENLKKREII